MDIPSDIKGLVVRPQEGFQCSFASTTVDVVWGGGILAAGKSFALVLALAEPLMTDPQFRSLISRRSLQNLKSGGGFVEKFRQIFGEYCSIKESDNPRVSFPSGAFCDLTYIDDSDMKRLRERAKGWEYDVIAIDEMTEMSFECFTYIMTRNRGNSKTFTGKMFATLNPKRSHWSRTFLDWYIGADGYIIPERDGIVRYFYIRGSRVEDVVWGDTKKEVYEQCRIDIDRKLAAVGGNYSYENLIKSFVFYQGKLSQNKAMLDGNADYIGSVAASGGRMAQALLEGNFNADPEEDCTTPVKPEAARGVFIQDAKANGQKWITADLADYGSDNVIILVWDGFHVVDMKIITHSKPRENANALMAIAQEYGIADTHIIFDATNARYILDYIPDAVPYLSARKSFGLYAHQAPTVKDMCYLRLVKMLNLYKISVSEKVRTAHYLHQNRKKFVSAQEEFLEECSVVRFRFLPNGARKLFTKKEMNSMLGNGRSMDLLDNFAMRMLPCAYIPYGEELEDGFAAQEAEDTEDGDGSIDIYDNSFWS